MLQNEEIVISGISGRYPNSDNIYELWNQLVNGQSMLTTDDQRWPLCYMGLPPSAGRMKSLEYCDSQFFNLKEESVNFMDPQLRILFEVIYETIYDAGVIPETLRGSNTALAVGMCSDDTYSAFGTEVAREDKQLRMFKRRRPDYVSKRFGFTGPAFEVDTACASSFSAMFEVLQIMKAGHCEQCIVAGMTIHLRPSISKGFLSIRMIAPDGVSKCLDESVNGFCRSEAVNALFLQKRKHAKRIYASIVNCETNIDGFKTEGITFPGWETQRNLMARVLKNSNVDPLSIEYIEGHLTGTPAGDVTESKSILAAYRHNSEKPIMFGCLKSNIGHTEGASAISAITKVALIFQKHCIPPNINFKKPNPDIEGLMSGQIIPVVKKTEYHAEIIPVNSFGFGGVNVHALLKANEKCVTKHSYKIVDTIPRLINLCGRTEAGLEHAMSWIENNRKDVTREFLSLLNDVSKTPLETGMNYRAFMVLDETKVLHRRVFSGERRKPLWFVFPFLGCHWKSIAKELMTFTIFADSIMKCAKALKTVGVDLIHILSHDSEDIASNKVDEFVSIVSIQIAITDMLYFLEIKPDAVIGLSLGEVAAAYADECLSAKEAVLICYYIGKYCHDCQHAKGSMATVTLAETTKRCLDGIYPDYENSANEIIVSGSEKVLTTLNTPMNQKDVFTSRIKSYGLAPNCQLMTTAYDFLIGKLKTVIKKPKMFSTRMVSMVQKLKQGVLCDAHYFAKCITSIENKSHAIMQIPENACVVQINESSNLTPLLKQSIPMYNTVIVIAKNTSTIEKVFYGLGEIYCSGNNVNIEKLYPKVEYPVPRETLSLSHLLKWDHSKSYFVTKFPEYFSMCKAKVVLVFNFLNSDLQFIADHCVDGRQLFPTTGYLYFVWREFAGLLGKSGPFQFAVEFKNIKLSRATLIPKTGSVSLIISIDQATGKFTVAEGNSECISGSICIAENENNVTFNGPFDINDELTLTTEEVYKELRVRGYDYGPSFQGLLEVNSDGSKGRVKWTGHWISFVDSILQMPIIGLKTRELVVPTSIDYIYCDPEKLFKATEKDETVEVYFEKETLSLSTDGFLLRGLNGTPIPRKTEVVRQLCHVFTPYSSNVKTPKLRVEHNENYFHSCSALLLKLRSSDFALSEDEEKHQFNTDSKEEYAFYKKLVVALKEKIDFNTFIENITNQEKISIIFKSNIEDIAYLQLGMFLENICQKDLNVVEYNETGHKLKDEISLIIGTISVKSDYKVFESKDKEEFSKISNVNLIIYKDLSTEMIIDEECTESEENVKSLFNQCYKSLENGGFMIFVFRFEATNFEKELLKHRNIIHLNLKNTTMVKNFAFSENFKLVSEISDDLGIVSLLFKKVENLKEAIIFDKMENDNFGWVEDLKEIMKDEEDQRPIWLTADEKQIHGTIGFMRCLKKEPGGHRIRCFVSPSRIICNHILDKDLTVNVIQNNQHGLYVFKDIKQNLKEVEHSYLDVQTKGDLNSLKWYESPHKHVASMKKSERKGTLVNVYYAAMNFKDVMIASGRIPIKAYPFSMHNQGNLGVEFSGIDENGNRVFGLVETNAFATTIMTTELLWNVPSNWTLAEAATIPMAYLTSYYALILRGKLKEKETVLIHAGSGAIGFGAITLCLSMNCEIYTSVGRDEKKQFLKSAFPQLKDNQFVNSRDVKFEEYILKETNGKGVDVILNCLAGEKSRASFNCLAEYGRFLEIGKYDIVQNNKIDSSMLSRNQSFHAICMAHIMYDLGFGKDFQKSEDLQAKNWIAESLKNEKIKPVKFTVYKVDEVEKVIRDTTSKNYIGKLLKSEGLKAKNWITESLKNEKIKPVKFTVYGVDEVEKAFRFMASGNHIGKLLIKIRDEKKNSTVSAVIHKAIPQTFCHPSKVYLIFGGLGGLGLETGIWLAQRGATKIVLTSRTGVKDNYQKYMIRKIEDKGVTVTVVTEDVISFESTWKIINDASQMGEIGGIFNLALVLNDALFVNQTVENFENVCAPKIKLTQYLDEISRRKCPELDYFVCFSSAVSAKGNAGQSNYGYASSAMENICEKRRSDNLHATAIQWGPIGDTGYFVNVAKTSNIMKISSPQRIPSFLASLDTLINTPHAVCCSSIPPNTSSQFVRKGDLLQTICYILGANPATVEDKTTLGDLGMDSLMAVEIRQTLERDYNTVLNNQEVRQLSIGELKAISKEKASPIEHDEGIERMEIDGNPFEIATQVFVHLNARNDANPIFFIPPIQGNFNHLIPLMQFISRPIVAINWTKKVNEMLSIEEIAAFYVKMIREQYPLKQYNFVGYSFGAFIAFEMSLQLQAIDTGLVKKLIFLDGDITAISKTISIYLRNHEECSEVEQCRNLIMTYMSLFHNAQNTIGIELKLIKSKRDLIDKGVQIASVVGNYRCTSQSLMTTLERFVNKLKLVRTYKLSNKFIGEIKLIHSSKNEHFTVVDKTNGNMKKLVEGSVDYIEKEGDHLTFLTSHYQDIGVFIESEF